MTMKRLVIVSLCCLLLSACNFFGPPTKTVAEFNAYVAANPSGLDGKTLSEVQLDGQMAPVDDQDVPDGMNKYEYQMRQGGVGGIVIQNMNVTNLTVDKSSLRFARIRNVTFVDCKFLQTDMKGSTLENVKFVNCEFDGIEPGRQIGNRFHKGRVTSLDYVAADNVVFDNVLFGKGFFSDFYRGTITLNNVKATPDRSIIIYGNDIKLRIINCTIHDRRVASLRGGNGSIFITGSDISGAGFSGSRTKTVWIEKTQFHSSAGTSETFVVQDCVGNFKIGAYSARPTTAYFARNQFDDINSSFIFQGTKKESNATLYLYGSNNNFPNLLIGGGTINISNVNFNILSLITYESIGITQLNLKNVTINRGRWLTILPETGYWENVQVNGPIEFAGQAKPTIFGYNVSFRNGSPWVNGGVEIAHLSAPREMEMPPVPTLEEVGLARFWKEIDAKSTGNNALLKNEPAYVGNPT